VGRQHVRSCTSRAAFPGREDFVLWCSGDGGFAGGEELAADQPAYCRLGGTLRDADGFGEILITDNDAGAALLLGRFLLLRGKPEVDEKARWAAIVADEIAQENVGDVRVKF